MSYAIVVRGCVESQGGRLFLFLLYFVVDLANRASFELSQVCGDVEG